MWRRRTTFVRRVLLGVDTLVSALAFIASLYFRSWLSSTDPADMPGLLRTMTGWIGERPPPLAPDDYQLLLLALLPLWGLSLQYAKAYDFRIAHRRIAWRYLHAVLLGVGMLILLAFLFKLTFVSRTFVVMFAVLQLIALTIGRVVLIELVRASRRRRGDAHRVVIVGTGPRAVEFAQQLSAASPINLEIQGFVGVMGETSSPQARPRLGYVGSLDALLDRMPVDEVVFAVPGKSPELFRDALSACDDRGVDVLLTLPPQVPSAGKMELANVSGVAQPMIGLRRTPTAEAQLALKRIIDIVGGSVGLLLAGPVMAITAIAIKLDSKGPVGRTLEFLA